MAPWKELNGAIDKVREDLSLFNVGDSSSGEESVGYFIQRRTLIDKMGHKYLVEVSIKEIV